MVVAAASDGACSGNPGPGGWGGLIRFEDGSVEEFGGFEKNTTNNRMELTAALEIYKKLKPLPLQKNLTIRTDSKYLIDGLNKWIIRWKSKNWKTSSGKSVLNQDLWKALDEVQIQDVQLEYVKGHSGDPDNERVDAIAVKFSKGIPVNLKEVNTPTRRDEAILDKESSTIMNIKDQASLQNLLSNLEIAEKFAEKGYALTLNEIAQLINEPIIEIKDKVEAWEWRNWVIEPLGNKLWILKAKSNIKSEV